MTQRQKWNCGRRKNWKQIRSAQTKPLLQFFLPMNCWTCQASLLWLIYFSASVLNPVYELFSTNRYIHQNHHYGRVFLSKRWNEYLLLWKDFVNPASDWLLNKKFILKQLKVVKVKETDNHKSLRDYWNTLILNIILALGNNVSRNKYNFLMQAQDVARWGGLFVLVFTLA